jgi:hypothetical protein
VCPGRDRPGPGRMSPLRNGGDGVLFSGTYPGGGYPCFEIGGVCGLGLGSVVDRGPQRPRSDSGSLRLDHLGRFGTYQGPAGSGDTTTRGIDFRGRTPGGSAPVAD